jgi:hypothetical protein
MAFYKEKQYIEPSPSSYFDEDFSPGIETPHAGIYRCMGCGREVGVAERHKLPPQNHHQHTTQQGAIRWRLVVYADPRPASER